MESVPNMPDMSTFSSRGMMHVESEEHVCVEDYEKVFALNEASEMGDFLKVVIRCILTECIDQLLILRNFNSQNKADYGVPVLEYMSLEERYMGSEDHAEYRINSVVSSYAKLAKDINTLVCILRETSDEIFAKGTFTMLKNSSHAILRMYEDEKQLMETFKNNARALKQLRRLREEERLANIRTMEETNGNIQKLRFEVEDVLVYSKYEATYFENWERTRREQNTIVCKQKENIPGYIISETRNKIDAENRCHVELENYIEESKNDYLDEIQYWMRHYDDETEKREAEMLNLKADIEKLMEDRAALKQKFDSHKAEIDDWVDYKTAKKEKEDRERLELWAAIKIQAWWRGTMVRKKLGPYRKKKGKGKDKGKGKGKKK